MGNEMESTNETPAIDNDKEADDDETEAEDEKEDEKGKKKEKKPTKHGIARHKMRNAVLCLRDVGYTPLEIWKIFKEKFARTTIKRWYKREEAKSLPRGHRQRKVTPDIEPIIEAEMEKLVPLGLGVRTLKKRLEQRMQENGFEGWTIGQTTLRRSLKSTKWERYIIANTPLKKLPHERTRPPGGKAAARLAASQNATPPVTHHEEDARALVGLEACLSYPMYPNPRFH